MVTSSPFSDNALHELVDDLSDKLDEMVYYGRVHRTGSEVLLPSSKHEYVIERGQTPQGIWGDGGEFRYALTCVVHRRSVSSIEVEQILVGVPEAQLRDYLESMRPIKQVEPAPQHYGGW